MFHSEVNRSDRPSTIAERRTGRSVSGGAQPLFAAHIPSATLIPIPIPTQHSDRSRSI